MNAPGFVFNQKERDEKKGERIADQLEMIIRSDEKKKREKKARTMRANGWRESEEDGADE